MSQICALPPRLTRPQIHRGSRGTIKGFARKYLHIFLAVITLPTSLRANSVEGYTGMVSYAPGEELTLHVSTAAPTFSFEIARLGAKSESVLKKDAIPGAKHPTPENASSYGCGWPASLKLPIPADWNSGYYHVTLSAGESKSSCYFVLRESPDALEPAPILLELATNTYNAYNNLIVIICFVSYL